MSANSNLQDRFGDVGFGVIGANSFVANAAVMPAIEAAPTARLVATSSRSGDVPSRWAATGVDTYDDVLNHPDVEVVYIPLPNGMHREWTERAAAAGKHVLCEKPLAADAQTARAMNVACNAAGVLLAEAWMTPFHRRYCGVLAAASALDALRRIETSFTFTIGTDASDNYRWDPDQGGGALLDVGVYCLGPIVELFDAAPSEIVAVQQITERGVDATTAAELVWPDGRTASIRCSFVEDESQTLHISAATATLDILTEAFTGGVGDDSFVRAHDDEPGRTVTLTGNDDPYMAMIDHFAHTVRGEREWSRPVERSIEMLELIERIANATNDRHP